MKSIPLGKHLGILTKKYIGVFSIKLQHLPIDRYFYPLILISQEKLTQQQLATKLGSDKVTIVRIVDYLSLKGMVTRKQNPHDRRQYLLELTKVGKDAIPVIESAIIEINQNSLEGLSAAEVKIFYKCLEMINSNLSAIPENDHFELDIRKKN